MLPLLRVIFNLPPDSDINITELKEQLVNIGIQEKTTNQKLNSKSKKLFKTTRKKSSDKKQKVSKRPAMHETRKNESLSKRIRIAGA